MNNYQKRKRNPKTQELSNHALDKKMFEGNDVGKVLPNKQIPGSSIAYLPPIFRNAHFSFIELLPNGDLICVFFSGYQEGYDGVAIVLSYLEKDSTQWTKPFIVKQTEGYSNQNPVIFYNPVNNHLYLWYTSQKAGKNFYENEDTVKLFQMSSDLTNPENIHGNSKYKIWSQANQVMENEILMAKGYPHFYKKENRLLFPVYDKSDRSDNNLRNFSLILDAKFNYNQKDDLDYKMKVMDGTLGLAQGHIVEFKDRLTMFFRDRYKKNIYYCDSLDKGQTWEKPERTNLINNNCGICALSFPATDGNEYVLMVFNNTYQGRFPLSIAISSDKGRTFSKIKNIETIKDIKRKGRKPEYSYPHCMIDKENLIFHLTYTFSRYGIKYFRMELDKLVNWLWQ